MSFSRCSTITAREAHFLPPEGHGRSGPEPDEVHGTPLPPLTDLIEQGKIVALNFPIAMNPGLARALGTMLTPDFQRAVLNRVHQMDRGAAQSRRPVLFGCAMLLDRRRSVGETDGAAITGTAKGNSSTKYLMTPVVRLVSVQQPS